MEAVADGWLGREAGWPSSIQSRVFTGQEVAGDKMAAN